MKRPRGSEDDDVVEIGMGSAQAASGEPRSPRGRLVGHILVPDIDERHGWREWFVYQGPSPKNWRPVGFGKP
jgi:hypothetical protein